MAIFGREGKRSYLYLGLPFLDVLSTKGQFGSIISWMQSWRGKTRAMLACKLARREWLRWPASAQKRPRPIAPKQDLFAAKLHLGLLK